MPISRQSTLASVSEDESEQVTTIRTREGELKSAVLLFLNVPNKDSTVSLDRLETLRLAINMAVTTIRAVPSSALEIQNLEDIPTISIMAVTPSQDEAEILKRLGALGGSVGLFTKNAGCLMMNDDVSEVSNQQKQKATQLVVFSLGQIRVAHAALAEALSMSSN